MNVDRTAGVVHVRHFATRGQGLVQGILEHHDVAARVQDRLPTVRRQTQDLLALEVQTVDGAPERLVGSFLEHAFHVVDLVGVTLDVLDLTQIELEFTYESRVRHLDEQLHISIA